jgi:hypothetical protein
MLAKDGTCGSDRDTLFKNDDEQPYSLARFNKKYAKKLKNDPMPV